MGSEDAMTELRSREGVAVNRAMRGGKSCRQREPRTRRAGEEARPAGGRGPVWLEQTGPQGKGSST